MISNRKIKLNTEDLGEYMQFLGYNFYSGVPCSFLKPLINYAINECEYIMAANEGDAIATCAGAFLGGKKTVFLCQNSGLGNAISPLTSLNYPFEIPTIGFVSLRGEPSVKDEPQHTLMGKITTKLLDDMEITWEYLMPNIDLAKEQINKADKRFMENQSTFFIVKKKHLQKYL